MKDEMQSNGFPTKRNGAGNQQNYVPAGDPQGGEYTFDSATGKGGDIEPKSGGSYQPTKTKEDNHIKMEEGDKKPTDQNFIKYVDSQNFRKDFKEILKRDFALGDKASQEALSKNISMGNISIKRTAHNDCCEMGGIVNLSSSTANDQSRLMGEVFWHESYHALDYQTYDKIPPDMIVQQERGGMTFSKFISSFSKATVSTRLKTSNGKTMLDTLKDEITNSKKQGVFSQINKDFQADLNDRLQKKFPNEDISNLYERRSNLIDEIDKKLDEKYSRVQYGTPQYNEKWKERDRMIKENAEIQRLSEIMRVKNTIKVQEMFKEWGDISDMCVAAGFDSFCGGHSQSYFKKDKSNKALEFLAEFGSAKATGDKASLDKFKKYFPETSKAAEECIAAIHKYSKGE